MTNLLPYDILLVQLFFGLEERKTWKECILAQEFTKLVQDVRVTQKVFSCLRTVCIERFLNVPEHHAETILERLRHLGWLESIQNVGNVGDVFIVLVESELFEEAPYLAMCNVRYIGHLLLFKFNTKLIKDLGWNTRRLLRLKDKCGQ